MKPLKLTIEGTNSFTDARTVDFEQLSQNGIFCICGPTGSGKTTILDCVILALYAPSNHNRGTLKEYINTKCEKGKITLDFSADGARYRVYRELRRNSSSAARLTNLDTGDVLADKADTVTDAVKKMLKLDKDDFTKVVVLEQGRYAEFMGLSKAKRCETVSKLFGLERFEKLKERVATAKNKYDKQLGEVDAKLKEYDGITEEAHADRTRRISALTKEREQITAATATLEKALKEHEKARLADERRTRAQTELAAAQQELAAAQAELAAANRTQKMLQTEKENLAASKEKSDAARVTLSQAEECAVYATEIASLEGEKSALANAYKKADADCKALATAREQTEQNKAENLAAAQNAQTALVACGYNLSSVSEAGFAHAKATAENDAARLYDAEKKRAEAEEGIAAFGSLADKLFAEQNALREQTQTAALQAQESASAYEHARIQGAAASIRGALSCGDSCPVCGGTYHGDSVIPSADDRTLADLKAQKERAENAHAQLRETLQKNEVDTEGNNAALRAAKEKKAEAENALGGKNSQNARKAAEHAQKGEQAAKGVEECNRTLADLAAQLAAAEKERERITADGKRKKEEIESRRARIAERLGSLSPEQAREQASRTVNEFETAQKSWEEKSEAFRVSLAECAAKEASARAKCESAQKTINEIPACAYNAQTAEADARALAQKKDALAELERGMGAARAEADEIRRRLKLKKELAKRKKELLEIRDNVGELNACVERDNKLFAYVAEEYVQSFTAAASETLFSLSGGKFTLYYDEGEFYVADFFADNARRKVKTLSGGETFLASMSIAMAISREIATQNYEFFFLDEGFGTLHERAMETVSEALVRLSRETAVGIVTHRGELAERIATRLNVIPATEDTGSDISVVF